MSSYPEYASIEAFVEFLVDDDRDSYTSEELQELNFWLHRSVHELRAELAAWGLVLAERPSERKVRGFRSNPHDRWSAFPSHGGSGWSQITGLAGQEG